MALVLRVVFTIDASIKTSDSSDGFSGSISSLSVNGRVFERIFVCTSALKLFNTQHYFFFVISSQTADRTVSTPIQFNKIAGKLVANRITAHVYFM